MTCGKNLSARSKLALAISLVVAFIALLSPRDSHALASGMASCSACAIQDPSGEWYQVMNGVAQFCRPGIFQNDSWWSVGGDGPMVGGINCVNHPEDPNCWSSGGGAPPGFTCTTTGLQGPMIGTEATRRAMKNKAIRRAQCALSFAPCAIAVGPNAKRILDELVSGGCINAYGQRYCERYDEFSPPTEALADGTFAEGSRSQIRLFGGFFASGDVDQVDTILHELGHTIELEYGNVHSPGWQQNITNECFSYTSGACLQN